MADFLIRAKNGIDGKGQNARGLYNPETTYMRLDVVSSADGSSFLSRIDNNLGNPLSDAESWQINARGMGDIEILQTTGDSTIATMSQAAITNNLIINCIHSKSGTVHTFTMEDISHFTIGKNNYTIRTILTDSILIDDTAIITDGVITYNFNMYEGFSPDNRFIFEATTIQPQVIFELQLTGGSEAKGFFRGGGAYPKLFAKTFNNIKQNDNVCFRLADVSVADVAPTTIAVTGHLKMIKYKDYLYQIWVATSTLTIYRRPIIGGAWVVFAKPTITGNQYPISVEVFEDKLYMSVNQNIYFLDKNDIWTKTDTPPFTGTNFGYSGGVLKKHHNKLYFMATENPTPYWSSYFLNTDGMTWTKMENPASGVSTNARGIVATIHENKLNVAVFTQRTLESYYLENDVWLKRITLTLSNIPNTYINTTDIVSFGSELFIAFNYTASSGATTDYIYVYKLGIADWERIYYQTIPIATNYGQRNALSLVNYANKLILFSAIYTEWVVPIGGVGTPFNNIMTAYDSATNRFVPLSQDFTASALSYTNNAILYASDDKTLYININGTKLSTLLAGIFLFSSPISNVWASAIGKSLKTSPINTIGTMSVIFG